MRFRNEMVVNCHAISRMGPGVARLGLELVIAKGGAIVHSRGAERSDQSNKKAVGGVFLRSHRPRERHDVCLPVAS